MMRRVWVCGLVLCVAAMTARADEPEKPAEKATDFKGIKAEYDAALAKYSGTMRKAQTEYQTALKEAKDDEAKAEAQKAYIKVLNGNPSPASKFAERFLTFAKDNAAAPEAEQALSLALSGAAASRGPVMGEVLTVLRDQGYAQKPTVSKFLPILARSDKPEAVEFFREVLAKNPEHKTQGLALKALLSNLENAVERYEMYAENPAMKARVGEEKFKEMGEKVAAQRKEMTEMIALAREKYTDVVPDLFIGSMAPEIVIKTVDDKDAKLSDLKGKVVVLDIWATWCGPCRAMIPHEREMVERLKDKPFTLVSISTDAKKETLVKFLEKESMPWTHWWNGNDGNVKDSYAIEHYPTIYVIDANGRIRFKEIRGEKLEKAVNTLLAEMEKKS